MDGTRAGVGDGTEVRDHPGGDLLSKCGVEGHRAHAARRGAGGKNRGLGPPCHPAVPGEQHLAPASPCGAGGKQPVPGRVPPRRGQLLEQAGPRHRPGR